MCQIRDDDIKFAVEFNTVYNNQKLPYFRIVCDGFDYTHSPRYFRDLATARRLVAKDMERVLPGIYNDRGEKIEKVADENKGDFRVKRR